MQRHMLVKTRHPHETLQRRRPHPLDILKPHMVGDQRHDLLRILIREAESAADLLAHPFAHAGVPVEPDPVTRL